MPYTSFPAIWENINAVDYIFIHGINPFSIIVSYGSGFFATYSFLYIPYLLLSDLGIHYVFLLDILFKIPSILGDVMIAYSIYTLTNHITRDVRKSLITTAVFFLNPFTIWLSAIVAHVDPFMMGFVSLAFVYLVVKKNIGYSAIFLAFSASFRFITLFLFPGFLLYLWREEKSLMKMGRFFIIFVTTSIILFSPYLLVAFKFYTISYSALTAYLGNWFVPIETGITSPIIYEFRHNFTGFLATFGLWNSVSPYFGIRVFLILYLVMAIVIFLRRTTSAHLLNRFAIVAMILFMAIIPLGQAHYLIWAYPFILMEIFAFSTIPRYYSYAIIFLNMSIFPASPMEGHFLTWTSNTFPFILGSYSDWSYHNLPFQLAVSVAYGLILLQTGVLCFRKPSIPKLVEQPLNQEVISFNTVKQLFWEGGNKFILFFVIYSVAELFRVAYSVNLEVYVSSLTVFSGLVLVFFWGTMYKGGVRVGDEKLLQGWVPHVIASLYLASILVMLLLVISLGLGRPLFLFVLVVVLGCLFVVNKRTVWALNLQRVASVFTVVYVLYTLLTAQNTPTTAPINLSLFLFVFLLLQVLLNLICETRVFIPRKTEQFSKSKFKMSNYG